MRRYDDPVDVRRGRVAGTGGLVEGPEQFMWRGRLWKVHTVLAQWVETGPWWRSSGVHAVLGTDLAGSAGTEEAFSGGPATDLIGEREVWRVEAGRGRSPETGRGVFDLVFDWADGGWRLIRCVD